MPIHEVPIHAVIFDMDGLMLDTEPLYRAAWQRAAAACGFTISDAQYTRFVGRRTNEAEKFLFELFGDDFPLDAFRTERRRVEVEIFAAEHLHKKPGLDELLALLQSRRLPVAVATTTDRRRTLHRLTTTNLLEYFAVLATGDDVSNGKPSPDLFLLAAERLRVTPANCLALEDSEPGVVAALRAGMQVYIVPDMNPPSASVERMAQGCFSSLAEVAAHLQGIISDTAQLAE